MTGDIGEVARKMAKELDPKNIRANSLCPDMISSTFHDTFTKTVFLTKVKIEIRLKKLEYY